VFTIPDLRHTDEMGSSSYAMGRTASHWRGVRLRLYVRDLNPPGRS